MTVSVDIMVGGKTYKLAVNEGQQQRVQAVAAKLDKYIADMRRAAPAMERDALLVMASMTMADDFLTLEQERATELTSLEAFHNNLASRLEKLIDDSSAA